MDLSCNEIMNLNDVENEDSENYIYQEQVGTNSHLQSNQIQPQIQQQSVITKLYFEACEDPTFLNDRCLENLLTSEKRYPTPPCFYFNTIQKNLTPHMRRLVAEWVIEVSELEFYCDSFLTVLSIIICNYCPVLNCFKRPIFFKNPS